MVKKQQHEPIIDTALALQFEQYMQKYRSLYRTLAERAKEYTPSSVQSPIIVDIGTGPGLLIQELQQLMPNARIIGIDMSQPMVERAVKNCTPCRVLQATVDHIPLQKESVDILLSRFSLYSWSKPEQAMKELYRVIKPGGKLILETLNKGYPQWKLVLTALHMRFNAATSRTIRYHKDCYITAFSQEQVEQFVTNAGFTILKTMGKKTEWKFDLIAEKPI